ncbi:MAG: putative N5,N10-methylenetetrahydromethanopterin reductase-related protein [Frankiales bacterium]|nr:putative N5,N10-methylenetetrahydromethanopterin reductase-related protein [Frankiales bacterium]
MKIDTTLSASIDHTREAAAAGEAEGYDGLWVGETKHDPFLLALRAAEATSTATVGTAIAIAFGRSPMTLAGTAFDLARYSDGRFVLGLGSQIKPHIERRFSMPWSHPAPRMREMVLAIKAIWDCWQNGTKLDFQGEFYTHTLMTPFFSPDPLEKGLPPVFLAGVGELMTEVAGEVGDGFFCHAFTTERYIREVTIPALARGAARAGRPDLSGFTVCGPAFVTVGRTDEELEAAILGTKQQIGFYASTPAYRTVLDLHGWGDIQPELTRLSKNGGWAEMPALIDDEVLRTFSVVGSPAEVAAGLRGKYDDAVDRLTFYGPYAHSAEVFPEVLAALAT